MNMYTVYDILGDCECCAGKEVIGMFTNFDIANDFLHKYVMNTYNRDISFTYTEKQTEWFIETDHDYEGYLAFEIIKKEMTDPEYNKKKLHDLKGWLDKEETIQDLHHNGVDLENFENELSIRVVQHFPDTIGLEFSDYAVTLTNDGRWFIEGLDGG